MPFFGKDETPVLLIGFQEQDNLGLGYVASRLMFDGYTVRILDYRVGREVILEKIKELKPLIVGFSIIFQYHIFDFGDLLAYLRKNGVTSHLTAGGHYPSLRYRELLESIPWLDSVVLFEGENTFHELVELIHTGEEWRYLKGVAWRDNGVIHTNPLRELEPDLDSFPIPVRPPLKEYALGHKFATLLAGRGCVYNCSFCSIREFYSKPPGPVKRIRRPVLVVKEMKYLFEEKGCTIFMFQDDDFPVYLKKRNEWIFEFCHEINEQGLLGKIIWKINCRPDEMYSDSLKLMRDHGLFQVYLGIENGTDDGLRRMNKHIDREGNIRAVRVLKEIGVGFDFGFMLFTPWTTFTSLHENLFFLKEICEDGISPVTFCKLLPYAETAVERELAALNRLIGPLGHQDYHFEDPLVESVYNISTHAFSSWLGSHNGVLNMARWANYTHSVYNSFFPKSEESALQCRRIRELIAQSNNFLIDRMSRLVENISNITPGEREAFVPEIADRHQKFRDDLESCMIQLVAMAGSRYSQYIMRDSATDS